MTLVLMMLLWAGEPKPMNVKPGDPIMDISVQTLKGQTVRLQQAMNTSFCFVLNTKCLHCLQALQQISANFPQQHHTVVLFINTAEETQSLISDMLGDGHGLDVYTVDEKQLIPYEVHTVPAMFYYNRGRLAMAFHGPFDHDRAQWVLKWRESRYGSQGD